jgi:uncharacterized RmlC-like cupin family protein
MISAFRTGGPPSVPQALGCGDNPLPVTRIQVVPKPAGISPAADGFSRRQVFETASVRVGETRVGPGAASRWHHHGKRTLYGYVVADQLVLEFGPHGATRVRTSAGDFFTIPPGLIHRDVNPAPVEVIIVNVIIGEGPATVEVTGPED